MCIGPGVLHKKKLETSYYTLAFSTVKYHPANSGVLVVGTDGEENLWKAKSNVFFSAVHLRCDLHLKENIQHKMSGLKINPVPAREITRDIFGCTLDDSREGMNAYKI